MGANECACNQRCLFYFCIKTNSTFRNYAYRPFRFSHAYTRNVTRARTGAGRRTEKWMARASGGRGDMKNVRRNENSKFVNIFNFHLFRSLLSAAARALSFFRLPAIALILMVVVVLSLNISAVMQTRHTSAGCTTTVFPFAASICRSPGLGTATRSGSGKNGAKVHKKHFEFHLRSLFRFYCNLFSMSPPLPRARSNSSVFIFSRKFIFIMIPFPVLMVGKHKFLFHFVQQ